MQTEIDEVYKEQVQHVLRSGVAEVVFTKLDGTNRRMLCTTNVSFIPESAKSSETFKRKSSDTSLAVWDLQKEAWRSFRYDSVISFATKETP